MSKILYFDCAAGISGDMTLGAFIDLGVDVSFIQQELKKLNVDGFNLEAVKMKKRGVIGTQCKVVIEEKEQPARHLSDITDMIENSSLSRKVKDISLSIFMRIAKAESKVHGISLEKVHFHEVGAIDSICDIIGFAICLDKIAPDKVYASAVNVGQGTVKCAHGILPVPAPATAEIIAQSNFPVYSKNVEGESATPTGMALLTETAEYLPELPKMHIENIGYGFGEREFEILNGLRLIVGYSEEAESRLYKVETNIDDMTGENSGYVMQKLLEMKVNDVFFTPIYMKKNRPAIKLSVICSKELLSEVERCILKETSSIGVRYYPIERAVMDRYNKTVSTAFGDVCVKVCDYDGIHKETVEYEDVARIAKDLDKPFEEIMRTIYRDIAE